MVAVTQIDFAGLPKTEDTKDIDPNWTLAQVLEQHRQIERKEVGFFRDGLLLGMAFNVFALNTEGPYLHSKLSFGKCLVDNSCMITAETAFQRMRIFATFCHYPEEVIEQVKTMGAARAYAIAPYVTKKNVYDIIAVAMRTTRVADLRERLLSSGHIVLAPSAKVKSDDNEELRAKRRQQAKVYGLLDVLGANPDGILINKQFFVPRSRPFTKEAETRFMLIYNTARRNHSLDEYFEHLMEEVYNNLKPEQQQQIDSELRVEFPDHKFDFEDAFEAEDA